MADTDSHLKYLRMSKESFDGLLSKERCVNVLTDILKNQTYHNVNIG